MVGCTVLTWAALRAGTGASEGSPRTTVSIWLGSSSSFWSAAGVPPTVALTERSPPEPLPEVKCACPVCLRA